MQCTSLHALLRLLLQPYPQQTHSQGSAQFNLIPYRAFYFFGPSPLFLNLSFFQFCSFYLFIISQSQPEFLMALNEIEFLNITSGNSLGVSEELVRHQRICQVYFCKKSSFFSSSFVLSFILFSYLSLFVICSIFFLSLCIFVFQRIK